jgi:hypothetical protein
MDKMGKMSKYDWSNGASESRRRSVPIPGNELVRSNERTEKITQASGFGRRAARGLLGKGMGIGRRAVVFAVGGRKSILEFSGKNASSRIQYNSTVAAGKQT